MDQWWGLDAEDYIASIRAGAIDPHGRSAAELEEQLALHDREWGERLARLTDDELDAVVAGRMPVPPLPGTVEPGDRPEHQREEAELAGRMKALELRRARLEAEQRELLAACIARLRERGGDIGMAVKESASNLASELRLSDRAMERKLTEAFTTVTDLPAAHEAHKAGRITGTHLRVIEQATEALRADIHVDSADRAAVEQQLVEVAERATPSQLRSRARRIVDRAMTDPIQQRHDAARSKRTVWLTDAGDGMVDLSAHLPAVLGAAIFDRLTQAARKKPQDDARTFDQFRADAFCELLLTGQASDDLHGISPIRATVTVIIPATELLNDADDAPAPELRFPGALDGGALVDAATIRSLAADTVVWERLFTHPVTGTPVAIDTYSPNRAMRRWLRARDGRCRWPGCASPVSRADADHTRDHALGGTTALSNLAHLCRRHHTMKHATAWTVQQLDDGVLEWTSPTGRIFTDEPAPAAPIFRDRSADYWEHPSDEPARCTASDPPWAHLDDCACGSDTATASAAAES